MTTTLDDRDLGLLPTSTLEGLVEATLRVVDMTTLADGREHRVYIAPTRIGPVDTSISRAGRAHYHLPDNGGTITLDLAQRLGDVGVTAGERDLLGRAAWTHFADDRQAVVPDAIVTANRVRRLAEVGAEMLSRPVADGDDDAPARRIGRRVFDRFGELSAWLTDQADLHPVAIDDSIGNPESAVAVAHACAIALVRDELVNGMTRIDGRLMFTSLANTSLWYVESP